MKQIIYILLAASVFTGCTYPKEYPIDFCTNLNAETKCDSNENTFNVGDRVYVLFECNQPFVEKIVTGKFYAIENSNKILLGSQDWNINPGDSYAYDYVDFTETGTYEFEFLNKQGEVLAKNKLEIK